MTAAESIPNITLGGVTVYTESVEKVWSKVLVGITPPQSSANWSAGPKDTKIVDLLRIELRFTVRGTIEDGSQTSLESAFKAGGVMTMVWDGTSYNVNIEKLTITKDNKNESGDKEVMFTALVGVDI